MVDEPSRRVQETAAVGAGKGRVGLRVHSRLSIVHKP
jgi:hypothetical protein